MEDKILEKIAPEDLRKISISLFSYTAPSKEKSKSKSKKIFADQERAISTFHNTSDYKVKKFLKYASSLIDNSYFEKIDNNENI